MISTYPKPVLQKSKILEDRCRARAERAGQGEEEAEEDEVGVEYDSLEVGQVDGDKGVDAKDDYGGVSLSFHFLLFGSFVNRVAWRIRCFSPNEANVYLFFSFSFPFLFFLSVFPLFRGGRLHRQTRCGKGGGTEE